MATTFYWCAWLRNKAMDYAFSAAAWTPAATLYVGLATSIADDGTITGEPSSNNYGRVAITNNVQNFPAATLGAKFVNVNVVFNQATGSWGTPTVAFISDQATGNSNTWLWGTISNSRAIGNGDIVYFAPGADINIALHGVVS